MTLRLACIVGALLALAVTAFAQVAPPPAYQSPPLSPSALRTHVETLSSNAYEGRLPGTRGGDATVAYIERAFISAGLQGGVLRGGQRSFRQDVPLVAVTLASTPQLSVRAGATVSPIPYAIDFVAWAEQRRNVSLSNALVVFAGYGVVDRVLGWNDYAGVDMRGRIALVFAGDPDDATGDNRGFGGATLSEAGLLETKIARAREAGAAGVLVIFDETAAAQSWDRVRDRAGQPRLMLQPASSALDFAGWINADAARALFAAAGLDINAERARAQRPDFTPTVTTLTASIALDARFGDVRAQNVIGIVPGNARPDEVVAYSANWDALGRCAPANSDPICHGAAENASGIAGLIELARRFISDPHPARSVAFIAFTGGEQGLAGSSYYAANPVIAPAQTVAAITLDQVTTYGPARDIVVLGAGQSDADGYLRRAVTSIGRRFSDDPSPRRGDFLRGDQLNFARLGVPVIAVGPGMDLFGGGVARGRALRNEFYATRLGRPADQVTANTDFIGATQDLLLLHAAGAELANASAWPNYFERSPYRRAARRGD